MKKIFLTAVLFTLISSFATAKEDIQIRNDCSKSHYCELFNFVIKSYNTSNYNKITGKYSRQARLLVISKGIQQLEDIQKDIMIQENTCNKLSKAEVYTLSQYCSKPILEKKDKSLVKHMLAEFKMLHRFYSSFYLFSAPWMVLFFEKYF
jgi:hypothetical protein